MKSKDENDAKQSVLDFFSETGLDFLERSLWLLVPEIEVACSQLDRLQLARRTQPAVTRKSNNVGDESVRQIKKVADVGNWR